MPTSHREEKLKWLQQQPHSQTEEQTSYTLALLHTSSWGEEQANRKLTKCQPGPYIKWCYLLSLPHHKSQDCGSDAMLLPISVRVCVCVSIYIQPYYFDSGYSHFEL